jgi:hypothetical protein
MKGPAVSHHDGEVRGFHCELGHAVPIEPSLRSPSAENGNIPVSGRRLSALSPRKGKNSEAGDQGPIRKRPPLAGLSESNRDVFPERRTAWLGREDAHPQTAAKKTTANIA